LLCAVCCAPALLAVILAAVIRSIPFRAWGQTCTEN
jgi:hypothetical protein